MNKKNYSNYKNKQKNYNFWLDRFKKNKDHLVCSKDIRLNNFENDFMVKNIKKNKSILEIGCGNAVLLKKLISKKPKYYLGTEFVKELTEHNKKTIKKKNIFFDNLDMTLVNKKSFNKKFDYIISKRAVQNVLSKKLQLKSIDNLGFFLKKEGKMLLMESSINAQKNINKFRKIFNLHKIIPPWHNLFLDDNLIKKYKFKSVKLIKIENFSSSFYFVTRIIYAAYAKFKNEKVNFINPLNLIATLLDNKIFKEDFSQIKMYIFKKK